MSTTTAKRAMERQPEIQRIARTDHGESGRRRVYRARDCEAEGCTNKTRENKPYCVAHIELMPYIQAMKAEVDEENRKERKGGRSKAAEE
jgi:hypothetical protein